MATVGSLQIELLGRIGDHEPHSLGMISIPLSLRSVSTGVLEAELHEALDYIKISLERIFSKESVEDDHS